MSEKTIQSIPVVPLALMSGAISALIGLIIGIFYAVTFGAIFAYIPDGAAIPAIISIIFGVGAIVIIPAISFITGFIHGALIALIYNFLSPRIGGVKLRFKEETSNTLN